MKAKKQPLRTCLGCRKVRPKVELLRIVRVSSEVVTDKTAKLSGRGAYICPDIKCKTEALKGEKIAKALRIKPDAFDKKALAKELERSSSD